MPTTTSESFPVECTQSKSTRRLCGNFCLTVVVIVIVSPSVTGRTKTHRLVDQDGSWPGNCAPSTVEINEALHAARDDFGKEAAVRVFRSTIVGLMSPFDITATTDVFPMQVRE